MASFEEVLRRSKTGEGLLFGELVANISDGARSDTVGVPDGATNAYVSGSDVVLQVFSAELGAWKTVTLS